MRVVALGLILVLGSTLALAVTADAQPAGKMSRIGYLSPRAGPSPFDEAFRQGLRELGYVEGTNIAVEYRWAAWSPDRLRGMAADLARLPSGTRSRRTPLRTATTSGPFRSCWGIGT